MSERQAFEPPRYATRGIIEKVEPELQVEIWRMIEIIPRSGVAVDYLQVFELAPSNSIRNDLNQKITHHQEQPPYMAINSICVNTPITTKIFVIDDDKYATMMLASEY